MHGHWIWCFTRGSLQRSVLRYGCARQCRVCGIDTILRLGDVGGRQIVAVGMWGASAGGPPQRESGIVC